MAYLIDTDILIYSLKNNDNVNKKFRENRDYPIYISVITYGELMYGAKKSQNVIKNSAIVHKISQIYSMKEISKTTMDIFADLKTNLSSKGKTIADMDLLIASTALENNLILVTNNTKHFQEIPALKIENWSKLSL